jgi:GST-like protein
VCAVTRRRFWQEIDVNVFPNVKRWYLTMLDRPAVQKGY